MIRSSIRLAAALVAALLAAATWAADDDAALTLVVMDPLAAPLSCPCVKGYAQRDYAALAAHLAKATGREVQVLFNESLVGAAGVAGEGKAARVDLVIGKRSVVEADAARARRTLLPVAALTDLDGSTSQRGLVVVRGDDPAASLGDLSGHRILLGPAECDEKHSAARALLASAGIAVPADGPVAQACSDGAEAVIAAGAGEPSATVISSYARPLLEGCGTIKRGDLKVVAETGDVPFIVAFVDGALDAGLRGRLVAALLAVRHDPVLRAAIESKRGFEPLEEPAAGAPPAAPAATDGGAAARGPNPDWPGWRGSGRDGRVAWLPDGLPGRKQVRWKQVLFSEGLGGVAVAGDRVIVGDRDAADTADVFHGLDRDTGRRVWTLEYPAEGRLDYGNSPRATPLVHDGRAYLLGAFGHLHCVDAADGRILWRRHLRDDFHATDKLVWGACSSPLVVDGALVVNPGAPEASLVALDPLTGAERWRTAGAPAAFASLVVCEFGGRRMLVGFDRDACGGWDPATGTRLWSLAPRVAGDFHVPTPVPSGGGVILVGENNGCRLVKGGAAGDAEVVAAYAALVPDMHTPVTAAGRLFAIHHGKAFCLDGADLAPVWTHPERSLKGHASLVASEDRVLALTGGGELVLLDARADAFAPLARQRLFERDVSLFAHPAVAGDCIYVRGPRTLLCVGLAGAASAAAAE